MDVRSFFVLAAILHVTGYIIYNIKTQKGDVHPNPASWAVWAFLAGMNALTYSAMTDWITGLQFIAGSGGCLITFLLTFFTGKFSKISNREILIVLISISSLFVYQVYKSAEYSNMIILVAFVISAEPTFRSVWGNPKKEPFVAWATWTVAFLFSTYGVYQTQVGVMRLIGPTFFVLFHGLVAGLSLRKRSG